MLKSKSIGRRQSFLLFFLLIGFAFASSIHSQSQIKAKYIKSPPKPLKVSSAVITVDDETQTPHTLVGGYYTTRNGLDSKLVLNNKGPQPIEVSPTLYGATGEALQIPPMIIERNSHQFVNLRDWANLGGEGFQEGNLRLFHRGKDLVLGTQIQIFDESKSLVFENKLSELEKFDSRRFEGVWWVPNDNTDSTIVLTNTGDDYLTVTATLTRKPHITGSAHTFSLLPHQTKVLNVREDFAQGNVFAKSRILGLSLTHAGAEDALLAWTMVKDASKGYSNIATFSNPAKAKSNQYHGAGLQLGSVGNDQLKPIVVLRNTTDNDVDVNIKVPYTKENGTRDALSLNTIRLKPREVFQVNMQRVINLTNIKTAGIEIEYTGSMGGVIAAAQSVSDSDNQVFRTLFPLSREKRVDDQDVAFSNIAFKKESERGAALRPDDCDCISTSPVRQETANLTVQPACAVPTNFRQYSAPADMGNGVLRFQYTFDSSTGNYADLQSCFIGEIITYPGSNPYPFQSPPFPASSVPNPFTREDQIVGFTGQPLLTDNHSPGGSFVSPYSSASFTATQYYRYRCPCANNGNYINIAGPFDITRSVSPSSGSTWKYTVTKSGASATIDPLP